MGGIYFSSESGTIMIIIIIIILILIAKNKKKNKISVKRGFPFQAY